MGLIVRQSVSWFCPSDSHTTNSTPDEKVVQQRNRSVSGSLRTLAKSVRMAWRGALSKNLKELRVHLCQTSEGSKGVRDFIFGSYVELKKANPGFPFLIRECGSVEAKMIARYEFGVEQSVSLEGKDPAGVTEALQQLIKMGQTMPK